MAKLDILKGSTSQSMYVFIQDSSVSTGAGKTGLAFNTASLAAYYVRPLANATAITLATQTVTGAYSSGGFVEVDAANMPGLYRLDVPNAVLADGVNSVVVMLKGAANMAPVVLEIQLVSYDPNDATDLGLNKEAFADALLNRDMSLVSDTNSRSPLNAFRFLRNKWAIVAGTLTVREEDDVTAAWTAAVTQTAGNPVSQIDPA